MNIPDKITLGAIEFEICNSLEEVIPSVYSGSANATEARIVIHKQPERSKGKTEQVFIHELTHMILDSLGYESGVDGPYNEIFIESISLLLHQAIVQIIEAQSES